MKALLIFFAALLCTSAWADGVPLFLPSPKALTAAETAPLMSARRDAKGVNGVVINQHAIRSNVITATVGGKNMRFIGQPRPGAEGIESWMGKDKEASLIMAREKFLSGRIDFDGRHFEFARIGGRDVLIELDNKGGFSEEVTPTMRENARRANENRRLQK